MKTSLFAMWFSALALTAFAPDAFAGPFRNCLPEDRLPGKRCADEWAAQDNGSEETAQRDEAGAGDRETHAPDSQE